MSCQQLGDECKLCIFCAPGSEVLFQICLSLSSKIIHIFIQFLVSCLEHLYRETEKESTKYPCALDSRGTILEKKLKQTKVTAC